MTIYDKLQAVKADEWICEYKDGILYRKYVSYKSINGFPKMLGYQYYTGGTVKFEGILQRGGLYEGRYYYPDGKLKFVGRYNEREKGSYYGPPYPVSGAYYGEDGELLYKGKFMVNHVGGVGWPMVKETQ